MKNIFRITALLLCGLMAAACTEKGSGTTDPPHHFDYEMANTTWEGYYDSPVMAPDSSTITFRLNWTMDFLTDTTGSLLCEITSALSQPQYKDITFSYNVEGSTGHFFVDGQEDTFAIDWSNNVISMDLQMPIDIGTGRQLVGGMTNLHRIR